MQKKKTRPPQGATPPENSAEPQPGGTDPVPADPPVPEEAEGLRKGRKSAVKPLYTVIFFYEWCKSCGICSALCPQKIILQDETGKPYIDDMDNCIGCRFCEAHCPDFAITVKERFPERRRKNDGSK